MVQNLKFFEHHNAQKWSISDFQKTSNNYLFIIYLVPRSNILMKQGYFYYPHLDGEADASDSNFSKITQLRRDRPDLEHKKFDSRTYTVKLLISYVLLLMEYRYYFSLKLLHVSRAESIKIQIKKNKNHGYNYQFQLLSNYKQNSLWNHFILCFPWALSVLSYVLQSLHESSMLPRFYGKNSRCHSPFCKSCQRADRASRAEQINQGQFLVNNRERP